MLKTNLKKYITNHKDSIIILCKQEFDYIDRHAGFFGDIMQKVKFIEKESTARFFDAYIERCNKETDETIAVETPQFLNEPVVYLKKHRKEYLYVESDWFDIIGIDGISLELDDVFGHYNCMLGLKMQKKYGEAIQSALSELLVGEIAGELMFEGNEGIWDVNFGLNDVPGYDEEMTLMDAFVKIYEVLFALNEKLEKSS
ncbi:hypothetical protein BpJC7_01380 [Weizmannia acidilactici]|uniref:Branched-chain amino acid aminotransferase n=1 Tax=Weizmannia acidilactici TaxID=2607726 RepID=A0A5J4JE27_9BACI|nr:hypothetical protein [Weizmannia acidilactici]GER66560.1 hypothetical protein BpJC4_10310 [Weizmannia acidilactici]GER68835.1 hypothetical protein BpJC7_01380 [Weizmannia acidilactici]GER74580.1 hypothetical protein BpPP18_26470 [Weizmannia acidilactici]